MAAYDDAKKRLQGQLAPLRTDTTMLESLAKRAKLANTPGPRGQGQSYFRNQPALNKNVKVKPIFERRSAQSQPAPVAPKPTPVVQQATTNLAGAPAQADPKLVVPELRLQNAAQQTSVIRGERGPEEYKFKNPQERAYQIEQGISDDQIKGYLAQKDAKGNSMWDARSAREDIAQRLTEKEMGYGLKDGGYGGFASYIGEDGNQRQLHTNPNAPNALFDTKEEAKRGQVYDVTGKEKAIEKTDADIFATREGVAQGWDKLSQGWDALGQQRQTYQNASLAPQKASGGEWQKIKDANGDEQLVLANPDGSYTNAMPRGFQKDAEDFQRYVQGNPKNKQAAMQRLRAKHGSIVDRYFGDTLGD